MFCWKNLYVYNHLDVDMRFKEFAQLTEELLKYPYSIYWITMHIYIYSVLWIYSIISDTYGYIIYGYLWIYTGLLCIYIYCIYYLSLPSSKKLLVTPSHLLPAWNLQGSPGWNRRKSIWQNNCNNVDLTTKNVTFTMKNERRRKPGSDLVLILISFRDGFRGSFVRTVLAFAATCIS